MLDKSLSVLALVGMASSLQISAAHSGKLFDDWPDLIICKKAGDNGASRGRVFMIAEAIQNDNCWRNIPADMATDSNELAANAKESSGAMSATYGPVHFHYEDASGNLRAHPGSVFMFCGPTVETAMAFVAPNDAYADDCKAGVTISELRNLGQTRDLGP